MKINTGAIEAGCGVWLRSGGPPMTVTSTTSTVADCVWFMEDESGPYEDRFPLVVLELIPERKMKYDGK
jgi:uncharacterized protein YodC (DUF2158 family)